MMSLNLNANIPNPDNFYNRLIDIPRDLTEENVQMMNAKLVLTLVNHITSQFTVTRPVAAIYIGT